MTEAIEAAAESMLREITDRDERGCPVIGPVTADRMARAAVIAFLRAWADEWEDETAAEIHAEADRLERERGDG